MPGVRIEQAQGVNLRLTTPSNYTGSPPIRLVLIIEACILIELTWHRNQRKEWLALLTIIETHFKLPIIYSGWVSAPNDRCLSAVFRSILNNFGQLFLYFTLNNCTALFVNCTIFWKHKCYAGDEQAIYSRVWRHARADLSQLPSSPYLLVDGQVLLVSWHVTWVYYRVGSTLYRMSSIIYRNMCRVQPRSLKRGNVLCWRILKCESIFSESLLLWLKFVVSHRPIVVWVQQWSRDGKTYSIRGNVTIIRHYQINVKSLSLDSNCWWWSFISDVIQHWSY